MQIIFMDTSEKIKALEKTSYFSELDIVLLQQVSEYMNLRRYAKGEVLFWEGDECSGLHIVVQGSVKLFRISSHGRQHIVKVLQEGEACNEVSLFDGGANPVNATALEDSIVWVVDKMAVQNLLKNNIEFLQTTIKNLSKMMRYLLQMANEMAFFQVTNRLARLLEQIPSEELSGLGGVRWTQDQLAARLGTVREVVARSLRELEKSGAISVENRKISIEDAEILGEWSQPWM